jgi:OOP family OmpA-OmpF porin
MNKNGKTIAIILGLLLAVAVPLAARAQAGDRGVYVGVGGGSAEPLEYDTCDTFPQCSKRGTAFKFFSGWQFGRNWAVEFGYQDLGKASASSPGTFDQSIKVRLSDLTILGQWLATERLAFFGKAGAYYANTTLDTTQAGTTTRVQQSRGNLTLGAGIQYYAWRGLAIRGEGQRFMKVGGGSIGDSDYNAYTLSLLYKF